MKITALKLSAIAIGATVLVGLFISCKDEGNTLSYDNASNKKNSIEEPTIVVKLINENNNDSSFWIGYETFYDELIWTTKKEHNNFQGGIYYDYESFGEFVLTKVSESVFEFYDPSHEATSTLENIVISEDKLSLTSDYIVGNVRYTLFFKDSLNKYDIFKIPIGEKIVLSEANFNAKFPWIPILKGLYHLVVVVGVAAYKACDDAIHQDQINCASKGCQSQVVAGCKAECIKCKSKE